MHFIELWSVLLLTTSVLALPTSQPERSSITDTTGMDYVLFDGLAYPDPSNPTKWNALIKAFVSNRRTPSGTLAATISTLLKLKGIDVVGDQLKRLQDRVKLFSSIGVSDVRVHVDVTGCSLPVVTQKTSGLKNLGIVKNVVPLGTCSGSSSSNVLSASVKLSSGDTRKFKPNIYPAENSKYGVISDIDDTVKISHVLNRTALIHATLLDEPKAVPGMPQLYGSLAKKLSSPLFTYVSGSPSQLYPFLHDFIGSSFPTAQGPIMLQNLTLFDPRQVVDFVLHGSETAEKHKMEAISRLHRMYPSKKWMMIGDSTQKDPEVYGAIANQFPNMVLCAWIRRVDQVGFESLNTVERFETAFKGVPKDRYKIFTDKEIPSLETIRVDQGKCH